MTVNQVVSIMGNYSESRDWRDAFEKVIPTRKQYENKEEKEEESVEPSESVIEDPEINNDNKKE